MVGMAVVSGTLLGSPCWQLASVVLIIATAVWTVASVVTSPPHFWLQNVGAVAPTLVATAFMANALRRQREAIERAEPDEHGGPAVCTPTRRGFGMRLIEEALAYETDGRVALLFPGNGLRCEIEVPVPPSP